MEEDSRAAARGEEQVKGAYQKLAAGQTHEGNAAWKRDVVRQVEGADEDGEYDKSGSGPSILGASILGAGSSSSANGGESGGGTGGGGEQTGGARAKCAGNRLVCFLCCRIDRLRLHFRHFDHLK